MTYNNPKFVRSISGVTPIIFKNDQVKQLETPSEYKEQMLYVTDADGVRIGSFGCAITADGQSRTYIEASKKINGTQTYAFFEVYINSAGKKTYNPVQLITTYVNGTSGYNIWSNGYCEQWGNFGSAFSSWTAKTITFSKTFANTNYSVWAITGHTSNTDSPCISAKTVSSFTAKPYNSTGWANWRAYGYLASGQY